MSIMSRPLTYTDLKRERETRDERLELIEGEIVVTPSPRPMHQLIQHRLDVLLDRAVVETGLGIVLTAPLDVFFEKHSIFQPDLVALLHERVYRFGSDYIEGAPSFAIEITSPSSGSRDRGQKRDLYARFGVLEYWVVEPESRTVTIYSNPREGRFHIRHVVDDIAVSTTIPELSVDLSVLFAPPYEE
jgi:Uma2 family endonuclease